jgi:NAD-dependent SIR2 family protein deacetylase
MFEFEFYCSHCGQVRNATADPVALLFGGKPDLEVTCSECQTAFRAVVTFGEDRATVDMKEVVADAAE